MKTPQEILSMSVSELSDYKWSEELNLSGENKYCSHCSHCSRCSCCYECYDCHDCSGCSGCSGCYMCRNATNLKWAICNVVVGEKAYRAKMKELGI